VILRTKQTGFSLMEVLIALAVLAIAMAALVESAGSFTSNQAYIENKTFAHWVALNQMAEQRIADSRLVVGGQEGQEEMAGRIWRWKNQISATPDPDVMKVEVSVKQENDETVYALLTGYVEVNN